MTDPARETTLDILRTERQRTLQAWLADHQREQAWRLQQTRALLETPVTIIDPHTHSEHSDGRATVAMNAEAGRTAGIDIVFATDHASIDQNLDIHGLPGMSWGQEPGGTPHHIGLLCNSELFIPVWDSLAADVARARKLAPFVWVPHPAGWYPCTEYSAEQMQALWSLAPAFAMEVLNAAHRIGTAFDRFDAAAVDLWDRLLADGIRVTPLGGSDAHVPESIGACWTALPDVAATPKAVIEGLNRGCCLASEGPLLDMHLNDRPMGSCLQLSRHRSQAMLQYRVVDAAGLQCIRIVADGRVRKTMYPRDATVVEGEWRCAAHVTRYVRIEVRATDNRRAFSAPIYLTP